MTVFKLQALQTVKILSCFLFNVSLNNTQHY